MNDESSPAPRFTPGGQGGPGRPKGSRAKLGEAFLEAMVADFSKHGILTIEEAREKDAVSYIKVIASLLPKEITGQDGGVIPVRIERVIIDPKN